MRKHGFPCAKIYILIFLTKLDPIIRFNMRLKIRISKKISNFGSKIVFIALKSFNLLYKDIPENR